EIDRGIKFALQKYFPCQIIVCPETRVEDVDPRWAARVEVHPLPCCINEAVKPCRVEERYVLKEAQAQPSRAISSLEVNQLIKCIFIGVIDVQNSAGHIIQPEIASAAPLDVADSNGYIRFNRKIII